MNNIAKPWERILSQLIDTAFFLMIPLFLFFIFSTSSDGNSVLSNLSVNLIFLFFVYPIVYAIFVSFFISSFGGTIGKLLVGIRIVGKDGQNISFWRAFFRNHIGYMISGLLFGLGFFWILVDKERRSWHDQIADTYVVSRSKTAFLGAISLVLFVFVGFVLISKSILNFSSNSLVYTAIFNEINSTFQSIDSKPPSP